MIEELVENAKGWELPFETSRLVIKKDISIPTDQAFRHPTPHQVPERAGQRLSRYPVTECVEVWGDFAAGVKRLAKGFQVGIGCYHEESVCRAKGPQ
jgi:hypothetical protein